MTRRQFCSQARPPNRSRAVRGGILSPIARLLVLVAIGLAAVPSPGLAQVAARDLSEISIEDLLNIEITSASRKEQRAADVAAAVFVITHDDIRRSGMTTIPDLLRLAPGVDVAQINSNKWAVSVRGFNALYANKLLVLIDGRSVYNRIFSGVLWDAEDLMLDDIDRIEVIRGPGAAIWGANAVNGVINIVTRTAGRYAGRTRSRRGGRSGDPGSRPVWRDARGDALPSVLAVERVGSIAHRTRHARRRCVAPCHDGLPCRLDQASCRVMLDGDCTAVQTRALWPNSTGRQRLSHRSRAIPRCGSAGHSGPFRPHRKWLVAGIAVAATLVAAPEVGSQPVSSVSVKAALLYNFAKFAEWPALPDGAGIVACIIGADGTAAAFTDAVRGQSIGRRRIEVSPSRGHRYVAALPPAVHCRGRHPAIQWRFGRHASPAGADRQRPRGVLTRGRDHRDLRRRLADALRHQRGRGWRARDCASARACSGLPGSSRTARVNSLGAWFRRQSVGRKLTTTALITSGVTLLAACTVFATYDYINSRSRLVRDVTMLADIVGTNSTAALTFNDAAAAAETLRATAVNEHILGARLFTRDGTLLATYMRPDAWATSVLQRRRQPAGPRARSPGSSGGACAWCGRLR